MRQSLPAGNIQQALSRNKDTTATAQLKGVIPDFYPSQADPILSKGPSSSTSTPLRPNPSHKSMPTVTVLIQTPHRSLWRLCPTGFLAFCPHLFNSQGGKSWYTRAFMVCMRPGYFSMVSYNLQI